MSIIDRARTADSLNNVPTDDRLQGLSVLFDVEQVRRVLDSHVGDVIGKIESCKVTYIRYKPSTNCIIAYSARYRSRDDQSLAELLFYGKCYTKEDFKLAAQKTTDLNSEKFEFKNSVIAVPDCSSVFYLFPYDTVLDGLMTISNSRKLVRHLYDYCSEFPQSTWRISDKKLRTTVIRYKPEKRAVIRIDTRAKERAGSQKRDICIYARTYADESGDAVSKIMNFLAEAFQGNPKIEVPRALGYIPDKKLMFVESVAGIPLSEQLESTDRLRMVREAAEALSHLHKIDGQILPKRSGSDALFSGLEAKEALGSISGEFSGIAEQIRAGLKDLKQDGAGHNGGFVHGDFHCGQVLIQDNGSALLDFDRSYFGETLADVGNFCAHLKYLEIVKQISGIKEMTEAFIDKYFSVSGANFDPERLNLWTVLGLLQFSVLPFRSLANDWNGKTLNILKVCRELI